MARGFDRKRQSRHRSLTERDNYRCDASNFPSPAKTADGLNEATGSEKQTSGNDKLASMQMRNAFECAGNVLKQHPVFV